jgi:hypothetical protein
MTPSPKQIVAPAAFITPRLKILRKPDALKRKFTSEDARASARVQPSTESGTEERKDPANKPGKLTRIRYSF